MSSREIDRNTHRVFRKATRTPEEVEALRKKFNVPEGGGNNIKNINFKEKS